MRKIPNKRKGKTLGERIRDEREDKDWSQQYFASEIGISPSMLSQIEADKREPSLFYFKRIVKKLNVSADYLLGYKDEKNI
nr:helix-turn-helix transcriptional regulator [Neobacillus sp. Marseille-Q6967]